MAYRLASLFDYRGYEPDRTSYEVAAQRLSKLSSGEVINDRVPTRPDRQFGALCAFEVLEHIEGDAAALISWIPWVESGGLVLLSVPAGPERFGPSDHAVGHYRRYSREKLAELMTGAGIDVLEVAAWGMPVGYLLDAARNMVLANRQTCGDTSERTARSGRLFQPMRALGRIPELLMSPFTYLQRPFVHTNLGVGLVAAGRVRS